MHNLGILYQYELKKLLKRKLVWVAGIIILLLSVTVIVGNLPGKYYVDGVAVDTHYNMMKTDREYARQLTGREIDQELLDEMYEAYRKVPLDAERYALTEEYQTYARPYSEIWAMICQIMSVVEIKDALYQDINENALYNRRMEWVEEHWSQVNLTEGEKAYWREQEQSLMKPFVFGYADGYWQLLSSGQPLAILLMLYAAICLSDFFSKEHTLRTDQALLSSRLGKKQLYWAKVMAGISFLAFYYVLVVLVTVVTAFGLYGADGANVMLQIAMPIYSGTLRAGTAILMMYMLLCPAILLTGIFVMMLSEVLHNGIAPLAIVSGVVMATVVLGGLGKHRILSQIYAYLPSNVLNVRCGFEAWLVPFFGKYLTLWQSAPIFWLIAAGIFLVIGKRFYQRYQVGGR